MKTRCWRLSNSLSAPVTNPLTTPWVCPASGVAKAGADGEKANLCTFTLLLVKGRRADDVRRREAAPLHDALPPGDVHALYSYVYGNRVQNSDSRLRFAASPRNKRPPDSDSA